ncbi:MCE family protein [Tomitella biformata]|uniref:MCE family protein n=1 Tax=Tomitella biformata TaxID=630403 RepID=UPI000465C45C|nr:MCE family protein [Tomitella biformata]
MTSRTRASRNPHLRRAVVLAVPAVAALALGGCQWDGIESLPIPGGAGHGPGAFSVVIEMPNVTTITRNSPVLTHDAEVGSITGIELKDWHAEVTVTLAQGTELPRNAVATIAQTSLLGSNHIQLAAPTGVPPVGRLAAGDVIALESSGLYPTTEQTLSALSVVLNGGGLGQVNEITTELNAALDGRTGSVRGLLGELDTLMGGLDGQRAEIVSALDGLDRLSAQVAAQNVTLDRALVSADGAVTVLNAERTKLTDALTSLGRFGEDARTVVAASGQDLTDNIANLAPVLQALADSGAALTDSLSVLLTFPFPMNSLDNTIQGDYSNLFMTLDLTVPRMERDMLRGTPLGRQVASGEGALGHAAGLGAMAEDPLLAPLHTDGAPR